MKRTALFVLTAVALVFFAACGAPPATNTTPPTKDESPNKTVPTSPFPGFSSGKYEGGLVIKNLDACEEFAFSHLNEPPGDSSTGVYLTVSPQGAVMVLEYEDGNTKAADYFETKDGGLVINGNQMRGGGPQSLYRFEMTFTHINGQYVGKGTWIIQDNCMAKAPVYQATITLEPR